MMYDEQFRNRVITYKDVGHTCKEVYEAFGVHSKSYYQWKKQVQETGGFQYNYPKSHAGKINEKNFENWSKIILIGIWVSLPKHLTYGRKRFISNSRNYYQ